MQVISGDLIKLGKEGRFDVIVHGCNCYCEMSAGIAKFIKASFPEAFTADSATEAGDRRKLGTVTFATVDVDGHALTIVNGYTQHHYSGKGPAGDGVLLEYEALRGVFAAVKRRFAGRRIGYPRIGAGLAGGDWARIAKIIDEELAGEDHTLVEFGG